ncbi:MAG TPA: hypothetical protein VF006_19075 [Longimicrobium sp.]
MDNDWVNRIGVILNFAAGFMVAPELIGLDRLRHLETRIERRLESIRSSLHGRMAITKKFIGYLGTTSPFWIGLCLALAIVAVIGLLFIRLFWYALGLLAVVYALLVYLGIAEMRWRGRAERIRQHFLPFFPGEDDAPASTMAVIRRYHILLLFYLPWRMLWSLIADGLFESIRKVFFTSALAGVERLIVRLEGNERLRFMVVFWGVVFFIAGNLLQFVGTFTFELW